MSKKKKEEESEFEENIFIDEEDDEDMDEEEQDTGLDDDDLDIPDEDIDNNNYDDDESVPDNPMGLAHQISKESETVKQFKELPREVKYSFYDQQEKADIKHYARTYRTWKYIEKIIDIRSKEDNGKVDYRENLKNISNKDDLKEYLRNNNRDYLINDIDDMPDEEVDRMIEHFKLVKANYFLESVESRKNVYNELYEEYREENNIPNYIDDMGNIGKVMDTSLASMGFRGNAAQHSVMTINAVKNEDIQKAAEEKTKFSLLDTIRRKLG